MEMRRLHESGEMGSVTTSESVFINAPAHNWLRLTYGDPKSWRNFALPLSYCTHSIVPLMFVISQRAVCVNGMEIPSLRSMRARAGSAAIELMQLSGGGMAKSLHGNLKHPTHYSKRRLVP